MKKSMGLPARKMEGLFTYADYKNWPDDERWELIDGVAWNMSPAPSRKHQWVVMELGRVMGNFLKGKSCQIYPAPFDVFLREKGQDEEEINNIVQPDLAIICNRDKLTVKGCSGAPDLVVEIVSPWTSKKDLNEKFNLYERFGVREYWVLDPGFEALQLYRLSEKGVYGDGMIYELEDIITSTVLPDFSFKLSDIFAEFE